MSRPRFVFGNWRTRVVWYAVAAAVVVLDQWTKAMALQLLMYAEPVVVTGFFNLTLLFNKGAAFSLLSDAGGWQHWLFSGVALVVAALILVWLYRLPAQARLEPWALALVLGGAVGNLIDRLRFGHVVDFIQLHYHEFYWPAFNIADAAITIGAGLLLLLLLRGDREAEA